MDFEFIEEDLIEFWDNVEKHFLEDGKPSCWLWKGTKTKENYGWFNNSSNTVFAHRFSFQLHGGIIPHKYDINHKCNIRCCVNPHHLEAITHSENMSLIGKKQSLNQDEIKLAQLKPLSRIEQCVRFLENSCLCIGRMVFPDYMGEDLGRKTVVDMLDILLTNNRLIFSYSTAENWDEKYQPTSYKHKWFWLFLSDQREYYNDISLGKVFEYYKPILLKNGQWEHHEDLLDQHITKLIDNFEFYQAIQN